MQLQINDSLVLFACLRAVTMMCGQQSITYKITWPMTNVRSVSIKFTQTCLQNENMGYKLMTISDENQIGIKCC